MSRGSHPTSVADRSTSPPRAAMLVDMNHLPSMPSRPGPAQSYASYPSYQRPNVAPSHPEIVPPTQHHRPRDPQGTHSHAQQLPSLRTLLEPELLDNKPLEQPSRSSGPRPLPASTPRYTSSSPTLKRRHDFDSYSHEYAGSNASVSRAPHPSRHTPSDARSLDFSHHAQLPGASGGPNDSTSNIFRSSSTASAPSASSDPTGTMVGQHAFHEEPMDLVKPARRRMDGSSRAPIRSTRCIGQRDIQGEGLCYVYEDGTFCRAVIDGEPVNPSWGITKAGKPRKRLAQACLTCREKKIKCEPGYPKCHQCAKSQRACRGGLHQPSLSNASGETSPSSSSILFKNQSTELISPVAGPEKTRAPEEQFSRNIENWNAGSPFKARNLRPHSVATSRDMSEHSLDSDWSGSANNRELDDLRNGSHQDVLALQWEQDPYETDPRLTMHLLDLYFLHAGRATYGMFPRRPFLTWVETREKNQDHLMLLYSVLAMGSIFSSDPEKRNAGKRYAAIAAYATEKRFGRFTLQLCQSRLVLALYNFARGKSQEAWDFCGAGLRALSALKLNTEDGIKELPETATDMPYGFERSTLEECCRRTFWSGFLMDRYNGFCGGTLCIINMEDTFLRLPCPEDAYEASIPSENPFFDFDILNPQASTGVPPLGYMAHLTLISAIWGEVLTFTSRAVHRPGDGYERLYNEFYDKTYKRLEVWLAMLPAHLRYTPQNLDNSIIDGFAGTFISLHALYHTTVIRINRHVRVHALSVEKLARNMEQAILNASSFVSMMRSLAAPNRHHRLPPNVAIDYLFSTPFSGYALMLSIDVLTAAGTVSNLPDLIEALTSTASCLEELASFWASARTQHKVVLHRIKRVTEIAMQEEQGVRNGAFGRFWKIPESLEAAFGNEDAMYKADEHLLFEVVGGLAGQ